MKILPKWYTFQVETGPFFNYYIQAKTKRSDKKDQIPVKQAIDTLTDYYNKIK